MTATELQRENEGLRHRLAEAEDTLRAIRHGKVNAIIVEGEESTQVFSLFGVESIYRRAVETMGEGVLNLAPDGTVQFCNRRFAQLLNAPEERLIGHHLQEWVAPEHHEAFLEFLQRCGREETRRRVQFVAPLDAPRRRPLLLTGTPLGSDGGFCIVAADLHELESFAYQIAALRESEDRLRQRISHLDLLAQVSQRLIFNHRTEQETLEAAFGAVGQAIGAEMYVHYQPRDEAGMRLVTWGGLTEDERTSFATMPYGELLCGRVAARREKLIVENIAHSTVEGSEAVRAAGYGAYAGFPMVDGEELLGTVAFITREKTHFMDGEVSLIQTISDQVTAMLQRSRLMRRLKESEERHRLALEGGDLGSWDVNMRTGEAFWNRRHAELQGYDPENELTTYEHWRQRLHPDDADGVLAEINQSAASRQPVALEHRILRADTGETRWLSLFGRFRFDECGEAIRFSGVSREITSRKEMEAALRKSEELARQRLAELEDIYRNAPVGLGVLDADLRFVRINERLAEMNGIPAADHIGRSVRELLPHLADFAEPILREVLTTGEPKLNLEITGETPAAPGVLRSWLEHWLPVTNAEGKPAGISIVAEETTERKRAEADLERALQQTKLLFSEVHHRVKNNLQILSSLINLQAEDLRAASLDQPVPVTPEALYSAFTDLRDRVRSMALVHQKLYRSESLSSLEFSDYIRSLLPALWRAHQPGQAIELVTNLSPVRITLDQAVPCGLILNELTVNSLTHAFRGRTHGTVGVAVSGDANQIRLLVTDDGVGLPPDTNWRKSRSLGLRLVQLLARQLEGTVELRRLETGGSEFAVTFPTLISESPPSQP